MPVGRGCNPCPTNHLAKEDPNSLANENPTCLRHARAHAMLVLGPYEQALPYPTPLANEDPTYSHLVNARTM